jgi:hypothetical protein
VRSSGITLMCPPGINVNAQIERLSKINGYTSCVEIERKGGWRRFRLS